MEDNNTEPHLLKMVSAYLMERGNRTMEAIVSEYRTVCLTTIKYQDWNG